MYQKPKIGLGKIVGLATLVCALFSLSCSRYQDFHPRTVPPCGGALSYNHQAHSYAAMLLTLQEHGWKIFSRDDAHYRVGAYACHIQHDTYCANLLFSTNPDGNMVVKSILGYPITRNLSDDLQRWISFFRQTYNKYSCFTDDALKAEVQPYGFVC